MKKKCVIFSVAFLLCSSIIFTQENHASVKYKPLDIDGAQRKEVTPFRNSYLSIFGRTQLANMLENAESFRLYVRSELKKRNMPSVLEYLPIIESDYKPSARSKDGQGVGLWQFMPNSVEPFLVVSPWIDERLDPWKSTQAALSKLQDNYNALKDWPLAIGAYNCGLGAMKRALEKSNEKTFWAVAEQKLIPDHTIRYVPKLLAVADLSQNSNFYGINLPTASNKDGSPVNPHAGDFDYVKVHQSLPLRLLASELRMTESLLESLNPALLYGITPPDADYSIRVPSGMGLSAKHAILSIAQKNK